MADLIAEIHAATRHPHKALTRLIATRLPLSLPPHANTPQLYAVGLSHFAEVYFSFEQAWLGQISSSSSSKRSDRRIAQGVREEDYDVLDAFLNDDRGRIRSVICQIYVPGILRSERLRSDLAVLRSLTVTATDPDSTMRRGRKEAVKQRHMKWSTDADADTDSAVRAFSSHIQSAVQRRPHVLLAYAWVLYMALFNDGRWRDRLVAGGPEFWGYAPDHVQVGHNDSPAAKCPLSFWFFNNDNNDDDQNGGEHIRNTFTRRWVSAATLLTETERAQVVAEAVEIFHRCRQIVLEIDVAVARGGYRRPSSSSTRGSSSSGSSSGGDIASSMSGWISSIFPFEGTTSRTDDLRQLFAGAAGILGGLCVWFWTINAEVVRRGYSSAWVGGRG